MGAGAFSALSLQELAARSGHRGPVVVNGVSPYGPIGPKKDESTGLELLKLPDGFRYWSYSWTGDKLSDGVAWPLCFTTGCARRRTSGRFDDDPR